MSRYQVLPMNTSAVFDMSLVWFEDDEPDLTAVPVLVCNCRSFEDAIRVRNALNAQEEETPAPPKTKDQIAKQLGHANYAALKSHLGY